jgi:homoserine dehydrogenase
MEKVGMKIVRVALIGFGNVGQGFAEILRDRAKEYQEIFGLDIRIVAVSDLQFGSVYDPDGLDPAALLSAIQNSGSFTGLDAEESEWDTQTTIVKCNADVIAEISFTDLDSGEPATSYVRQALKNGKHVITTNKGPIALHFSELDELAQENGVRIGFEGTVMSGTPALRLGMQMLRSAGVRKIEGILNGTTNYILSEMTKGLSYQSALKDAQRLGYAEADPRGDVEGHDAAAKVAILSTVLMGSAIRPDQVERTGITGLTQEKIGEAQENGQCWKLIGSVEKKNGEVVACVKPMCLPRSHPFAAVNGATNAIHYTTDLLGEVTLIGPGAGRVETGLALINDLISIYSS